ncbi:hypothetical protein CTAYLR_007805 [Chrysophaeum taylorii]|uniref:Uncharacterized protein n=1 Tax=Chrysophaeum taylorii TaxID=2483200 RepID=A0AAD7XL86_9STRA|nr:hypothetical protein CTAYLR_007805 [Chrysophaeum taylorii]
MMLEWVHRIAGPVERAVRIATFPVRVVLSGNWVPKGPWIVIWGLFAFASSVQTYKQILGLSWTLVRLRFSAWRRGASLESSNAVACELCDSLIGLLLKFDANSPQDIACEKLCPSAFGGGVCVRTCERIVEAIRTSSRYPCKAAKLCPDANGEEAAACTWERRTRSRCERHPGLELWAKYQNTIARHAGALAAAWRRQPRCNARHALFCVRAPRSWDSLACDYASTVLVGCVGLLRSIAAIESEGGNDDKSWLTFWIVFFAATQLERFASVLLSRLRYYYHLKLLVTIYLVGFGGAETCYHKARSLRYLRSWQSLFMNRRRRGARDEDDDRKKRRALIEELETKARFGEALASLAAAFRERPIESVCRAAVDFEFGPEARDALLGVLETKEFAFLYVHLHAASVLDDRIDPVVEAAYVAFHQIPLRAAPRKRRRARARADDDDAARLSLERKQSLVFSQTLGFLDDASTPTWFDKICARLGLSRLENRVVAWLRRLWKRWRTRGLVESLLGTFVPEALVSVCSSTSKTLEWHEDLELKLVGGYVDDAGYFRNAATPRTNLLVQLYIAGSRRPDFVVGEATIHLAELFHGALVRFDDLPLWVDGGDDAQQPQHPSPEARLSLSLRLGKG